MRPAYFLPTLLVVVACATTPTETPTTAQPAEAKQDAPADIVLPTPLHVRLTKVYPPQEPYNRDDWSHWSDADGDCQDTRAEVLIARSRARVTFADDRECRVVAGEWLDPYTGEVFTDARELDIDHVVTLKDAHDSGASSWGDDLRERFANDPANLLPVSRSANRSKGARSPDQWLPPVADEGRVCWYVELWLYVKTAYRLGADPDERDFVHEYEAACLGENGRIEPRGVSTDRPDCCRVCKSSNPCGDSCISKEKTCRRPAGCACTQ